MLEAGGRDTSPFIKVPAGVVRAGAKHDWGYRSQPDPTRYGAAEEWVRGRVLGGSSSINGTLYMRGTPQDFDRWCMPGWSAADIMPLFRQMECSDQPGPLRGHSGPLYVRTVKRPHAITEAFIESACAAGFPFNQDYNGEHQFGVGPAQLSQRRGFRCSAADAFLRPMLRQPNVTLLLNALVERIEIENGRAVGVSFLHRGRKRYETARNIALCAGVINSPKLLMLSGIGDKHELRRHGIHVSLDLPGVGRNLLEHPMVTLLWRAKVPTTNLTEGVIQKLGIAARFLIHGDGPISDLFEALVFAKSRAAQVDPDLQVIFMSRGFEAHPSGGYRLMPFPAVAVHILETHPKSRGQVKLASRDPSDPPLIECRLLDEQADVDALVDGIAIVRRIMREAPMSRLIREEIAPGAKIECASVVEDYVRRNSGISFHPIGTCRMGTDVDSVVGPDLRVHGIENLWIADASIIPRSLSANMNAVCMMIGKKLGKQLISAPVEDVSKNVRSGPMQIPQIKTQNA